MPLNPLEITGGLAIGEGVGMAIADVVEPQLRDLKNTQSAKHTVVPLPGELAARLIAESRPHPNVTPGTDAGYLGISRPRFDAMVELARVYPTVSEAITLWRRGYAAWGDVSGWLHYNGYSDDLVTRMIGGGPNPARLFYQRLSPAQIALGIIRSIIPDPGLMPVSLDTAGGVVPRYPQTNIDPLVEALEDGYDRERLRVLVGEIGLPMSPQQAASALFRGIIERPDFNRAIVEGDTRPEWADAMLAQARQILTAGEYAELQLRGFLTQAERRAHTAKHGMSQADSDLLFDVLGRSVNVHQIVTGEARGGVYKPPPATLAEQSAGIPRAFLASLERGNLRPEYYDLAYANRYSYPSAFVTRALLQAGAITAAEGEQIFLDVGWIPWLAKKVADHYGTATTAVSDPHVTKAQAQLWTTIHRSYLNGESDAAEATSGLPSAGVASGAVAGVLAVWDVERSFIRKQLTPTQIKKAYRAPVVNPATGANWTYDEARAELVARGYSLNDAETFLAE